MASGFTLGENIETADVMMSMDQRYQEYEAHLISTMALGTDAGVNSPQIGQIVRDDDVPRFRKLYIDQRAIRPGQPIAGRSRALGKEPPLGPVVQFQRDVRRMARCSRQAVGAEHAGADQRAAAEAGEQVVADRHRQLHARRKRPARAPGAVAERGVHRRTDIAERADHTRRCGQHQPDQAERRHAEPHREHAAT